jgi:hypothetical protein
MHSIFRPGFPGLLENIYLQEVLMKRMIPGVYAAFVSTPYTTWLILKVFEQQKHNISTTSYATKWYITLFANSLPFQSQLRLWDAFLLEGQDIIVVMALCIVWSTKGRVRKFLLLPAHCSPRTHSVKGRIVWNDTVITVVILRSGGWRQADVLDI